MNKNNLLPNPFDQEPLPSWDKNEVWQQIEAQLPPRKRRRMAAWWWWLGIGCVVTAALYSALPNIVPSLAVVTQHDTISGNAVPLIKPASVTNNLKNSLATLISNALLEKNANQRDSKMPVLKAFDTQNNRISPTKNNTDKTIGQPQPDLFAPPIMKRDTMASDQAVNTITTNSSPLPVKAVGTHSLPVLQVLFLKNVLPIAPVLPPDMPVLSPLKQPVHPALARTRFIFGIDGGATIRRIKANIPEDVPLASTYQSATRPMETVGVQAGLLYQMSNHWAVGAGLRYQSTQHWFRFSETTTLVEQITSDSASFYEINGVAYYQSGLLNQTTTTTHSINAPGRIARFFIPVVVQYTTPQGLYGQMSLLWNIHNRYHGYALSPQGTVLAKDNPAAIAAVYHPAGAHATQLALGYRFAYRKGWQFRAGVQYQMDWGSVLHPSVNIRQRDQVIGLTLSIAR